MTRDELADPLHWYDLIVTTRPTDDGDGGDPYRHSLYTVAAKSEPSAVGVVAHLTRHHPTRLAITVSRDGHAGSGFDHSEIIITNKSADGSYSHRSYAVYHSSASVEVPIVRDLFRDCGEVESITISPCR